MAITEEELRRASDCIRERNRPLRRALSEIEAWSTVWRLCDAIASAETTHQRASCLAVLVVFVDRLAPGGLDRIAADRSLLPATVDAIQMVRQDRTIEEIEAHLAAWEESEFGPEVTREVSNRLHVYVRSDLRIEEMLAMAWRAGDREQRRAEGEALSVQAKAGGDDFVANEEVIRRRSPENASALIREYRGLRTCHSPFIKRKDLRSLFGIPPTSVDADFQGGKNAPDARVGSGKHVAYSREYLIDYVVHRREPRPSRAK